MLNTLPWLLLAAATRRRGRPGRSPAALRFGPKRWAAAPYPCGAAHDLPRTIYCRAWRSTL